MELDPFTMLPAPPRNPPGLMRMFEYPDRAEQLGAPPLVEGTTLATVSGLGGLERLEFQCTKVTDDGLVRIVAAMPLLESRDIRGTDITADGAMATGRLKNLRTLGLSGNVLTIRLAEHLEDETALAQVDVCPPHPDFDEETEAIDIIGGARFVGELR